MSEIERVLFVEDEFDVLDPLIRRLRRKSIESDTADFETAEELLAKIPYVAVVFDQYLGVEAHLGSTLFTALRNGRFGTLNQSVPCAFFTALSEPVVRESLQGVAEADYTPIFTKGSTYLSLYEFLGVGATRLAKDPSRARTLVEIEPIRDRSGARIRVPGWSDEEFTVRLHRLPEFLVREMTDARRAGRYTAEASLDAKQAAELRLDDFQVLRNERML